MHTIYHTIHTFRHILAKSCRLGKKVTLTLRVKMIGPSSTLLHTYFHLTGVILSVADVLTQIEWVQFSIFGTGQLVTSKVTIICI